MPQPPNPALRLLSLACFASMAAMRWCDALVPVLAQEFACSPGESARVVYAFAMAYGVMQLFYGPWGDRFGKFRVVGYATIACAIAALASSMAPNLAWLTLARAVNGAAAAGIIPLTMAWVGDNVPWEERQNALARLLSSTVIGMIAGQWLAALFADTLGWRYGLVVVAILFAVAAFGLRRFSARTGTAGDSVGSAGASGPSGPAIPALVRMRVVLGLPVARQVLWITGIEGAFAFSSLAFAPTHLHLKLGMAVSAAGAAMALYGFGGIVYSRTAPRLLRHFGQLRMAQVGGLLAGLSWLGLAWVPNWWAALPLCGLAGLGFYMLHNTLQARATQMAPEHRGTAVSLFASSLFIGQSAGMLACAWAVDHFGTTAIMACCGVGIAGVGMGMLRLPTEAAMRPIEVHAR